MDELSAEYKVTYFAFRIVPSGFIRKLSVWPAREEMAAVSFPPL